MTRSRIAVAVAVALGLGLAASADAADRAAEELDLRPLKATPLECMRMTVPQVPDATAFCSTTIQRIADAPLESPVPAWIVKAQVPVVALVLASNITAADQRTIGSAFETATRCLWEPDRRVVRVDGAYVALYTATFAGAPQPILAVLTPYAARQQFGDGTDAIGTCKPAI